MSITFGYLVVSTICASPSAYSNSLSHTMMAVSLSQSSWLIFVPSSKGELNVHNLNATGGRRKVVWLMKHHIRRKN